MARQEELLALPSGMSGFDMLQAKITSACCAVLAFAGPEDGALWETRAEQLMEARADILMPESAGGFAEGESLFLRYLKGGCRHALSGRVFTRDLGIKASESLDALKIPGSFPVWPVFAALLHLHARHCVGIRGGERFSGPDDFSQGPGRFMALAALLHYVVPLCRQQDDSPALSQSCSETLENLLFRERELCLRGSAPADLLRWGTEIDVMRALIISHPLMREVQGKAAVRRKKTLRRARLAAWARWLFSSGSKA
ncbi:MAG: hypothetical protein LBR94_08310 [Desulfovibrio sp.]|nr:hypothetical protein [Desulfovibrio sp.]